MDMASNKNAFKPDDYEVWNIPWLSSCHFPSVLHSFLVLSSRFNFFYTFYYFFLFFICLLRH